MSKRNYVDLRGQRFGRLVAKKKVLGHSGRTITKGGWCTVPAMWECLCDCGRTHIIASKNLTSGRVKSCGCWRKEWARKVGTNSPSKFKKKEEYPGCLT